MKMKMKMTMIMTATMTTMTMMVKMTIVMMSVIIIMIKKITVMRRNGQKGEMSLPAPSKKLLHIFHQITHVKRKKNMLLLFECDLFYFIIAAILWHLGMHG